MILVPSSVKKKAWCPRAAVTMSDLPWISDTVFVLCTLFLQAKKAAKEAQKERRKTKIKKHVKQQRIKHTSGSKKK